MKKTITALVAATALTLTACGDTADEAAEPTTSTYEYKDPVDEQAKPTHDWLMEQGAKSVGLSNDAFRSVVILSCGYAEQEQSESLETIRAKGESAIRAQVKDVPEDKVTPAFLAATATGCPHLIQGQGVNGLKLVLAGQ